MFKRLAKKHIKLKSVPVANRKSGIGTYERWRVGFNSCCAKELPVFVILWLQGQVGPTLKVIFKDLDIYLGYLRVVKCEESLFHFLISEGSAKLIFNIDYQYFYFLQIYHLNHLIMSNSLTQNYVQGLKSRNPEVRSKAARDLYLYVSRLQAMRK